MDRKDFIYFEYNSRIVGWWVITHPSFSEVTERPLSLMEVPVILNLLPYPFRQTLNVFVWVLPEAFIHQNQCSPIISVRKQQRSNFHNCQNKRMLRVGGHASNLYSVRHRLESIPVICGNNLRIILRSMFSEERLIRGRTEIWESTSLLLSRQGC